MNFEDFKPLFYSGKPWSCDQKLVVAAKVKRYPPYWRRHAERNGNDKRRSRTAGRPPTIPTPSS
jgi:hypothetical protein